MDNSTPVNNHLTYFSTYYKSKIDYLSETIILKEDD